jgi:arylformamidase
MRFIDISVTVDDRVPLWPGDPPVEVASFLQIGRGDAVNASRVSCSVHTGTHVDAPCHHFKGGVGVDALPLGILIGPAVVVDARGLARVGRGDLEARGVGPGVDRLLLKTDNSALWAGRTRFHPDFVALCRDAAAWLVDLGVKLVGIDYLSVERFGAREPVVHRALLGAGIVILEGLDLGPVAAGAYRLICLPIKLGGLDGAPARAVLVDDREEAM